MQTATRLDWRSVRLGVVLIFSAAMFAGIVMSAAGSSGAVDGTDTTTLNLDHNGSDIIPEFKAIPARGLDTTRLYLDRYGADIPEGNWWGKANIPAAVDATSAGTHPGPDTSTLNLDSHGADVAAD